jgi:hypothetical protein
LVVSDNQELRPFQFLHFQIAAQEKASQKRHAEAHSG